MSRLLYFLKLLIVVVACGGLLQYPVPCTRSQVISGLMLLLAAPVGWMLLTGARAPSAPLPPLLWTAGLFSALAVLTTTVFWFHAVPRVGTLLFNQLDVSVQVNETQRTIGWGSQPSRSLVVAAEEAHGVFAPQDGWLQLLPVNCFRIEAVLNNTQLGHKNHWPQGVHFSKDGVFVDTHQLEVKRVSELLKVYVHCNWPHHGFGFYLESVVRFKLSVTATPGDEGFEVSAGNDNTHNRIPFSRKEDEDAAAQDHAQELEHADSSNVHKHPR